MCLYISSLKLNYMSLKGFKFFRMLLFYKYKINQLLKTYIKYNLAIFLILYLHFIFLNIFIKKYFKFKDLQAIYKINYIINKNLLSNTGHFIDNILFILTAYINNIDIFV